MPGLSHDELTDRIAEMIADAHAPALSQRAAERVRVARRQRVSRVVGIALGIVGLAVCLAGLLGLGAILIVVGVGFAAIRLKPEYRNPPHVNVHVGLAVFEEVALGDSTAIWVDRSGIVPEDKTVWPQPKDTERLSQIGTELQYLLKTLPAFLSTDHRVSHDWESDEAKELTGSSFELYDVEAYVEELSRELKHTLQDRTEDVLRLAAISPTHSLLPALRSSAPLMTFDGTGLLKPVLKRASPATDVRRFRRVTTTTGDLESWLDEVSALLAQDATSLTEHRDAACRVQLREYEGSVLRALQDANFVCLCPRCNEDFIRGVQEAQFVYNEGVNIPDMKRTATMKSVPATGKWRCQLCEVETPIPFPVPRLHFEVLLPAFRLLMSQHHADRQGMYADIDNQKRHYLNEAERELFQRRDSHKRDASAITMRCREAQAQAEAAKKKLACLGALLAAWQLVATQRLTEIAERTADLTSEIARSQASFETRYADANQRILDQAVSRMRSHAIMAQRETAAQFSYLRTIASNTNRAAQAAERAATATEQSAAVNLAFAHEAGLLRPPAWNVFGRAAYDLRFAAQRLTGRSTVASFHRSSAL